MFIFLWILAAMGVAYWRQAVGAASRLVVFAGCDPVAAGRQRPALGGKPLEYPILSASHEHGIAIHRGGQIDILLRHAAGIMGRQVTSTLL